MAGRGHRTGIALAVLLACTAPTGMAAQAGIGGLERELAADVVRDSLGSVSAAVFVGDEVVWRAAFGWEDRATGELAGTGTIHRAGSLSKIVTALVLLRLVESGVVTLDDPVLPHFPELVGLATRTRPDPDGAATEGTPVARAEDITFRQLASHTAGLAREPDRARFGRGPFLDWKRRLVAAIPWTRAPDPPGTRYRYSNIGYGLLGFALERAAGRPFEQLADSLVFRPLGMRSSFLVLPYDDRDRLATGYVNLPGDTADPRVPRAEHRGRGYRVPGEGVYSTASDLARLGMALTGAIPLIPDSLRHVMLTVAAPAADEPDEPGEPDEPDEPDEPGEPDEPDEPGDRGVGYGLGVQLLELGGVLLAGHSGTIPGYAAYLLVDPGAGTGVVLLRSYNNGETNLGAAATRLLLELRSSRVESEPSDATLDPHAT